MDFSKQMKNLANGDKNSLELLYREYKTLVFAVGLSVLRNKQDAEDITADTFVALYKNARYYRGGSVKCYIATIARNLSLNKIKSKKAEVFVDFADNESLYGEYSYDGMFNDNLAIKQAITALDDDSRQIVLMHNSGLKHREIATILTLPLGTITWKYNEALKKLKKLLTENN